MNTKELSQKLTQKGASITPSSFETDVREWFKVHGKKLVSLLGSVEDAKRLVVAAVHAVNRNPKLMECEFSTFEHCLMTSATLGLFPGVMEECSYVPLFNSRANRYEANFWPEYKGLAKLGFNSGFVLDISTAVVWEADFFDYEEGDTPRLKHKPNITCPQKQRGQRVGAYSIITLSTGKKHRQFVSAETIEGIKNSSPGGKKSDSPWNSQNPDRVDWMWRKTALKPGLKLVPKSAKMARALNLDDSIEIEAPQEVEKPILNADNMMSEIELTETKTLERPKERVIAVAPKSAPLTEDVIFSDADLAIPNI